MLLRPVSGPLHQDVDRDGASADRPAAGDRRRGARLTFVVAGLSVALLSGEFAKLVGAG
jgi:hypothetical protein